MNRYTVESRRCHMENFANYVGDFVYAETEDEAIDLVKGYYITNGCDPEEVEKMEFRVVRR